MSKYSRFIFTSYNFDADTKMLQLNYSLDDELAFTETYRFDFNFVSYAADALDRALQNLFFIAGVSYYKTYLPPTIEVKSGSLDARTAAFFNKTYQRGLGEFFYVNQLNPQTPITFPITSHETLNVLSVYGEGPLIALGGGKDSLVSVELLKTERVTATWSVGHKSQLEPLVNRTGLPHFWVERTWDPRLLELNKGDAFNGHVPISAILACVGTVIAILSGKRDVVMSNENSANEPTLTYQGVEINHQYSKSLEFEQDYQALLKHHFGDTLRYYSLLRPFSEMRIAELFAQTAYEKYKDVFSSCNRAFSHDSDSMFWCGKCPKCAFVFLVLTPFVDREELEKLFSGKNLLLDEDLDATYGQLLGIEGDKPLECVGEIKESRMAMHLAQSRYPELSKYRFELPHNYDFRALSAHSMPAEIFELLVTYTK